jgi:hypothetical protein
MTAHWGAETCTYKTLTQEGLDCPVTCNADKYDTFHIRLKSVISSKYVGTLSQEKWMKWRDFICEGDGTKIFVGDHVESASPVDPSFWPIHPTLERILHGKMMAGGFKDNTWPSDSQNDYVCDKFNCYEDGVAGFYDQCCYGHYEDDQLLDYITGDDTKYVGATNKETLAASNPLLDSYSVPYVYDSFQFDHCDNAGELVGGFDGYIKSLYDSSNTERSLS